MPRTKLRLLVLSTACALVALPAAAAVAAPAVTNTNDSGPGSLRAAIEGAAPGETVNVPAGTYSLTSGPLVIEKSLTVAGHTSSDTVVRAGESIGLFKIGGIGNNVALSNLTVRDALTVAPGGVVFGGAISDEGAGLTLQSVVVTNNRAIVNGPAKGGGGVVFGGAIYAVSESPIVIKDSTISGNVAAANGGEEAGGGVAFGGGAYLAGPLTIEGTAINDNRASARGGNGPAKASQSGGVSFAGGLFAVSTKANSTIAASAISRNVADTSPGPGGSGGVAEAGGALLGTGENQLSLQRTTIAANAARTGSGGITIGGGLLPSGKLGITGATIAGNEAGGGSTNLGGNLVPGPGVQLGDTIVSGGISAPGSENCAGAAESLGFNLESTDQCNLHGNGDIVNADPLLGALQSNGGPTETMALASNSPAVDKGAAFGLGADQRGVKRPIDFPSIANSSASGADGSDIGAFELQPVSKVTLGKLAKHKKKGTATLTVKVPTPAAGKLTLSGKGLKTQKKTIKGSSNTFKLKVIATGKAKKALNRDGKRKVKVKVTYSPTGNSAAHATKKAALVKS